MTHFNLRKAKIMMEKALISINEAMAGLEKEDYVKAGEGTYEAEKFTSEALAALRAIAEAAQNR